MGILSAYKDLGFFIVTFLIKGHNSVGIAENIPVEFNATCSVVPLSNEIPFDEVTENHSRRATGVSLMATHDSFRFMSHSQVKIRSDLIPTCYENVVF